MRNIFNALDAPPPSSPATMLDAVNEFGVDVVRPLVLSLYLFQQLTKGMAENPFFDRVLSHGMRVGRYARQIVKAENGGTNEATTALIGGLLHDIGYLVLANLQSELFAEKCEDLLKSDGGVSCPEGKIFALSHVEAGALLLMTLGFPLGVIEIVAYHHSLGSSLDHGFGGLAAVHVADALLLDRDDSCFKAVLNDEYLTGLQCQDRLPAWKEILQIAG